MIFEGLITAALGALLGSLVGAGVSLVLAGSLLTLHVVVTMLAAALAAAGIGVIIVLLALLLPVQRISSRTPTSILAED